MSYTPKVGDRVRRAGWLSGNFLDVEHVGASLVVGRNQSQNEIAVPLRDGCNDWWEKLPKRPELPNDRIWVPVVSYEVDSGGDRRRTSSLASAARYQSSHALSVDRVDGIIIAAMEYEPTGEVVWRGET